MIQARLLEKLCERVKSFASAVHQNTSEVQLKGHSKKIKKNKNHQLT